MLLMSGRVGGGVGRSENGVARGSAAHRRRHSDTSRTALVTNTASVGHGGDGARWKNFYTPLPGAPKSESRLHGPKERFEL